MKYKVIGWTYYENSEIPSKGCGFADYRAILEEITRKGYRFSGYAHQEFSRGVPVMNDGKRRIMSSRSWGALMAKANGYNNPMDYTLFAEKFRSVEAEKMPPSSEDYIFHTNEITDEDLSEEFTLEVSPAEYARVLENGRIAVYEEEGILYLDVGDRVRLKVSDALTRLPYVEDGESEDNGELYSRLLKMAAKARPDAYEKFLKRRDDESPEEEEKREPAGNPTLFAVTNMERGWDLGDRENGITVVTMDRMSHKLYVSDGEEKEKYNKLHEEGKRIFYLKLGEVL